MRITTLVVILALAQAQTPELDFLLFLRAQIEARIALLTTPPIRVERVQPGQDAQAVLDSMLGTGGVIEVEGAHDWDVQRPYREVQPLITIRGLGAATIRGIYLPVAGNLTFEDLRVAGNPGRSAHIQLGGDRHAMPTEDLVPVNFTFRRITADGAGTVRRGMTVNARHVLVEDSAFLNYYMPNVDSQAVGGWNGTADVIIRRNILEGGSQNVMFGGSDAASEAMFPRRIRIEANILRKRREWIPLADLKCLLELKNAIDVEILDNELDGMWSDAWFYAPGFKVNTANQEGSNPTARVENVLFQGNTVRNVGQYVNIVGSNAGSRVVNGVRINTSGVSRHIRIVRNRFTEMHLEGDGRAVVVNDGQPVAGGPQMDVLVDHNTFELNRHSYAELVGTPSLVTYTNNLARRGTYGLRNQNGSTWSAAGNLVTVDPPTEEQIVACVTTDGLRVGC